MVVHAVPSSPPRRRSFPTKNSTHPQYFLFKNSFCFLFLFFLFWPAPATSVALFWFFLPVLIVFFYLQWINDTTVGAILSFQPPFLLCLAFCLLPSFFFLLYLYIFSCLSHNLKLKFKSSKPKMLSLSMPRPFRLLSYADRLSSSPTIVFFPTTFSPLIQTNLMLI